MRICLAAALIGTYAWAQAGLDRPQLGEMLDAAGSVRPLYGVAGSVTSGDVSATGVLSMACSRRLCLMKTDSTVLSRTGAVSAPPGPALFALDGDAALVYFPQSKKLARWHNDQLDPLDWEITGDVLSLRAAPGGAIEAAVRRGERVWIERISPVDGGVELTGSLPRGAGAVMLLDNGVLFAAKGALILRHRDGTQIRFEVPGAQAMFPLGEGYVEVRTAGSTYAVRVEPGRERVILLPEPWP